MKEYEKTKKECIKDLESSMTFGSFVYKLREWNKRIIKAGEKPKYDEGYEDAVKVSLSKFERQYGSRCVEGSILFNIKDWNKFKGIIK